MYGIHRLPLRLDVLGSLPFPGFEVTRVVVATNTTFLRNAQVGTKQTATAFDLIDGSLYAVVATCPDVDFEITIPRPDPS